MAELGINFKYTKDRGDLSGKTGITDADLIAMNSLFDATTVDATENKLGSTYKGTHIIGTTEAEKLCLNEAITVQGVTVGNVGNSFTFAKGTSIQDILKKILCKTIDVKAQAPTAALTPNNTTTLEYGSAVGETSFTLTLTQGKFVGAESGYSTNQAMDCKLTEATIGGAAATVAENGLTATYTLPAFTLTAEKSVSATAKVSANTVVPKKNDGTNSAVTYAGGSITCSGTRKWTPQYKAFYGYSTKTSFTSADVRGLNAAVQNVSLTPDNVTMFSGNKDTNGTNVVMACPPGYKFVSIKDAVSGTNLVDMFSTATVAVTCGSETVNYTVYYLVNTTGNAESYKEVVIGKA